jgi:uncharacterized protein (DUF433 family)
MSPHGWNQHVIAYNDLRGAKMTVPQVCDIPVPLHPDEAGALRVGATRVTLDTLIRAYADGCTAEEIVEQFPDVSLADVHAVIAYYLTHSSELDAYLQARQTEASELRMKVEALGDPRGRRERLLARQAPGPANA